MTNLEDRRVRKTRRALQTALLELVVKEDYEAITVADICDAADVGRSAFYHHFKGKDDLLRGGFAQLEADLEAAGLGQGADFGASFLEHAFQHRELYRALMRSQAGPIVLTAIRRILGSHAKTTLDSESTSGVPRELRAALLVDLLLSLTGWWLERDAKQPVLEIDGMFKEMAAGIIGRPNNRYANRD